MFSLTTEAMQSSDPAARAGHVFLSALSSTQESLELRIKEAERDLADAAMSENVKGHIMATIGKANLLITQKFVQFKELCLKNIEQSSGDLFQTHGSDLAGFWEVVMIQVDEVQASFGELATLKANNWQEPETTDSVRMPAPRCSQKGRSRSVPASPMSSERAELAAKARTEARKKFMEARRQMLQESPAASSEEDVIFYAPPEKSD
ncbi:disks large-associated protein 1-like [Haemaphysalis longicornis]|uniref:Guanylate-kinase-associated protein n=1 Tax=Haemaphysalis longicornis TaxID=44386 RepID=A0A9J6FEW0_HAELO|nr:hypothetical protein HPB48_008164 [Haemaphysalis longicornis]